jgi:hypothetical protein
MEWDDGDNGDDRESVNCVPAKDVEVNGLGVWLPGCLADY